MKKALCLYDLSCRIKEAVNTSFPVRIWVTAEISSLNFHRSGHCYLELIDKEEGREEIRSRARATIWANVYHMLRPYFESTTGHPLAEGMKVMVKVSPEYHEVYGFSLHIHDIEPSYTLGEMELQRQATIKKLEEEGVIDMNKAHDLAPNPQRIAIISSSQAAGYQDFMNQIQKNEYGFVFYTVLFEAGMQGKNSPAEIVAALHRINEHAEKFDVAVIIRGGGSQTDLAWFDHYDLAFHISQFPIPVLTGIGHERDISVADMVAYRSLKTPTAVAAFLIDECAETDALLDELTSRLKETLSEKMKKEAEALRRYIVQVRPRLQGLMDSHHQKHLQYALQLNQLSSGNIRKQKDKLTGLRSSSRHLTRQFFQTHHLLHKQNSTKIKQGTNLYLRLKNDQIKQLEKTRNYLDPVNVLKRGFSVTTDENGRSIKSVKGQEIGNTLVTHLFDGKMVSKITKNKLE